jgi:hypothetical protein
LGDLDGDGLADLAVANDGSDTLSVLRSRPNGTFMAAVHHPVGDTPKGVAIADINGDGQADLLSANTAGNYPMCCNPGGDTISLLLNTGNGSFAAAQTYSAGTTPFAVAAGDLDGDGDLDVVTANWHSDDVTILRNEAVVGPPAPAVYLSDLSWTSMQNGWGPVERNRSNGENNPSDGRTITLNGVGYTRGLGVHAFSDVRFALHGACSSFSSVVGVDDEVGSLGSVVFQVLTDGVVRFNSGIMTGASPSQTVSISVAGAAELQLVVFDGGDGVAFDHADWADAKLVCGATDTIAPTVIDIHPRSGVNNVPTSARADATFSEAMAAGTLTGSTVTLRQGSTLVPSVVTYDASTNTVILDPNNALAGGTTYTVTIRGGAGGVTDLAVNPLGSDHVWSFTTAPAGASLYLSDTGWATITNGWGPVERDLSNGEIAAGDGHALTLNGTTYGKGLGAHASSEIRFALNGRCSFFSAIVGVDDEVGSLGSVTFEVWTDGVKRFDSALMTGDSPGRNVLLDMTGRTELVLIVTDGASGGNAFDHADWAEAQVSCQ